MPTKKMLGEFEQLVLLGCLRLEERACTPEVMEEIRRRTGRDVSHAAVYIALRRMEKRGLVRSKLGQPSPEPGGRAKRYFTVLPAARQLLEESRRRLLRMWEGVESP